MPMQAITYLQFILLTYFASISTVFAQTHADNVDITALRQDILEVSDVYSADQLKRLYAPFKQAPPNPENSATMSEVITEGVISEYLEVLDFMAARAVKMEALREASTPGLRAYADLKNKQVKHLILHQRPPFESL